MDERRIQEIVERVLSRLDPQGVPLAQTPMEAVLKAADGPAGQRQGFVPPSQRGKDKEARIPRGGHGLFPDVDSAVKAARQAFTEYQNAPLSLRERIVANM